MRNWRRQARRSFPTSSVSTSSVPRCWRSGTTPSERATSRAILSAEEIWCQGFSEPDAGSDLASLRTQAVARADDVFVINGQKTWTSWGQYAQVVRCAGAD